MKRLRIAVCIVTIALAMTVLAAPPPLKVDKSAPLLLDDAPAAKTAPALPRLICYDCHGNFREELLALKHANNKITCVTCHGDSSAHASDEGNITPPEVMYARDAIAKKCQSCHKEHTASAAAVAARRQERGLQTMEAKDIVCTDCHGKHRMNVRVIHWDKNTGKLLGGGKKRAE
ncbi:MAG: cytochrome c3 family protein [Verrucomicrobiia bacterium]|jgi:formate-dependent nitrite reductase cytochrome c552 subunit